MDFRHAEQIWADFPELVAGVVFADRITADQGIASAVAGQVKAFYAEADKHLAGSSEAELPAIAA